MADELDETSQELEPRRKPGSFLPGHHSKGGRKKMTPEARAIQAAIKKTVAITSAEALTGYRECLALALPALKSIVLDTSISPDVRLRAIEHIAKMTTSPAPTKTEQVITASVSQTIAPETLQALTPDEIRQALALDDKLYGGTK